MSKLKVGFVINGDSINCYQKSVIESIIAADEYFLEPVVYARMGSSAIHPLAVAAESTLARALYALIFRAEKSRLTSLPKQDQAFTLFPLSKSPFNVINLDDAAVSHTDHGANAKVDISRGDIVAIQSQRFDVLVVDNTITIDSRLLDCATQGVLVFEGMDRRAIRAQTPGFWESFKRVPSTGFEILHYTAQHPNGVVLRRGNLITTFFWLANAGQVYLKGYALLFILLRQLAAHNYLPTAEVPQPFSREFKTTPTARDFAAYIVKAYGSFVWRRFERLKGLVVRWGVSYFPYSGFDLPLHKAIRIPNPPKRFLADPFVIEYQGKTVCFLEDYFYDEAKGKISVMELNGDQFSDITVIIDEPFHMSYPFVFEYQGKLHMIPETAGGNAIRLYRCEEFPYKWQHVKDLMADTQAADTVVFQENDQWVMLTNMCSAGVSDFQAELHVFYADDLLADQWTPSVQNPILVDSLKGRNGGFFELDGARFRVNQVHGVNHYGRSMIINRVIEVRGEDGSHQGCFSEQPLCHIQPDFYSDVHSTHHFHTNGKYTVFDHCSSERKT